MKSPKQDAILALMRAASDCPHQANQDAFWEYQSRIMEPLRENIRKAMGA